MMMNNKINIAAVITALLAIGIMMPGSVDNVVNAVENGVCPSQDSPPATGDSCVGLLIGPNLSQSCMYERYTSTVNMGSFECVCSNAAGSTSVNIWSCDGTFAPAVAPTYMPAGQIQPTTTITISKDAEEDLDVSDMDITDEETATTTSASSDDSGASSFSTNFKVMVAVMVAVFATSATTF